MKKRLLSLLLTAALLTGLVCIPAWAETESEEESETEVTEVVEDDLLIGEEQSVTFEVYSSSTSLYASGFDPDDYYQSTEEAGVYLREQMVERSDSITISYYYELRNLSSAEETLKTLGEEIVDAAVEHTGVPDEGDYLTWQHGDYSYTISYYPVRSRSTATYQCYITFLYEFQYYTTAEQEAEVTERVSELVTELDLDSSSLSDYEKVRAIYDYICGTVSYDYDGAEDGTTYCHTAHSALFEGKAVCQGYALLFYRLALEAGIDARFLDGTSFGQGHGWNMVELENEEGQSLYYLLDSTWDAGRAVYQYFLLGSVNFSTYHTNSTDSQEIIREGGYSVSREDYEIPETEDESIIASGVCGSDMTWTLTTDGTLTIYGNDSMYDYEPGTSPWYEYASLITSVVVENAPLTGVLSLGSWAFYGCTFLVSITLPDCLETIGTGAFSLCTSLASITIPENVTSLGDSAFSGCTGLEEIIFEGDAPQFGEDVFSGVTASAISFITTGSGWTDAVMLDYGGDITWIDYAFYSLDSVSDCALDSSCPMYGFTDLDLDAWYHDGIHYVIDNGFMLGTSSTTFEPGTTTSRAMVVTILYRLAGSPETEGASSFTDAVSGSWYEEALAWAEAEGIAEGYGTGEFGVSDPVSREQLAAFFYRYAEYAGYSTSESEDLSGYPDAEEVDPWAETELSWAVGTGLITGTVEGGITMLAPADDCLRSMTAAIIYRFMGNAAQ